jgi:CheY-like chemotaxis protein
MNAESLSLRILYVEDHADTAEVFARVLEDRGYCVQVATDCAAALAVASRNYFDLMICDIALPDGDGCQLLIKLRQRPHLRSLCAIAFTALATAHDLKRIKATGFDGYVLKPTEADELFRVIDKVCCAGAHDSPGMFFSPTRLAI